MAESEARGWVLVWVEDLHLRAVSKHFWEEQEQIDLRTSCLICPATFGKYGLHTDYHRSMRIDKSRCFSVKQVVHPCW